MSGPSAAAPGYYDGDGDGGGSSNVPIPFTRQQQPPQPDYSFSGRVLLTAVIILAILTVIFVLVRLLLYQFVARGRGGGAQLLRRSFSRLSARRGLDASALAALPVTAYRRYADGLSAGGSSSAPAGPAAATECAVCLSELADGEKVRALPGCGHVFHVECVDAWLRSRTTCPVCRADVRTTKGPGADARTTTSAPAPPPPALFGAGGTLVVTVQDQGAGEPRTSGGVVP